MKIVNWNCNGALRKKLQPISVFDADLYIIQECENPAETKDKNYYSWAGDYLWFGHNKNKGIGVFAKNGFTLEPIPLESAPLEYFLPFKVNNKYTFLAVWTREANSPTFKYIGQLWKYLQLHKNHFISDKTVIIGDLNSNVRWDSWDRWWNHSDVVRELDEVGICSLYHHEFNEEQGKESKPTFYLQRNVEKPYHIDYAFISNQLLSLSNLKIGEKDIWLEYSDHMPLSIYIND